MNICNDEEGIYLIHTREFYNNNKPIFKIGRSHTLENRIKYYPKGSKIICMINCINSVICEKELIKIFKEKFTQKLEYGIEYFEGDKNDMIIEILLFIHKMIKEVNESNILRREEDRLRLKEENKKKRDIINEQKKKKINDRNTKIKDIIKHKIKNEIQDRTCPKCNHKFKYPSLLKIHFRNVYHCLLDEDQIKNFFTNPSNPSNPNVNTNTYRKCSKEFNTIKALKRHNKETQCGKS